MEVSYTLTAEDLEAYLRFAAGQPTAKQQQERVRLLGSLIFVLLAAVFALSALSASAGILLIGAAMMLGGAVLSWFVVPPRIRSLQVKAGLAAGTRGNTAYLLGPRTAKIDENGLALLGPGLLCSYTWDLVDHVAVGEGVYVFMNASQAHIVPASAFPDAEAMRRFARTAEGFLEGARRPEG